MNYCLALPGMDISDLVAGLTILFFSLITFRKVYYGSKSKFAIVLILFSIGFGI